MADPLSMTASIVSVLHLSTAIVKYLKDVGEYDGLRSRLLLEISTTKGILETLQDLSANATQPDPVFQNVASLQEPLSRYKDLLQKIETVLAPSGGIRKVGKAVVWPFEKSEIKENIATLERYKGLFGLALHADQFQLSRAIREQLQLANTLQMTQEFNDVVRWLSPLNFEARHRDIFSKYQEGTGQWLLDDPRFKNWQTEKERLLWCYGVPGAGKTVFACLCVEHLRKTFRDQGIAILGIYCDYREYNQQSTSKYLASLLGQLLTNRSSAILPDQVRIAHESYRQRNVLPTFPEYLDMVSTQIASFKHVYVVIDALDECTEANNVREELLDGILQLPTTVSVMLTSRYIPGVELYAQNASHLTIQANDHDVTLHVKSRLIKEKTWTRRIRLDNSLQDRIVAGVIKRANGMFLLAQLHITSIVRKHSRKDVERALRELPEGLSRTYDQIVQRIHDQGEDDATLAIEIMSWLTYAKGSMTAEMLQHALAIRPQDQEFDEDALIHEDTLLDVCAGLVVIDPGSTVIHFVHYTTQEYFLQTRKAAFPASPLNIVTCCLTFLLFDKPTRDSMPDLYTYIADSWGHHARESPETTALVDKIVLFVKNQDRLRQCVENMSGQRTLPKSSALMSGLHLTARFDLAMTMERLLVTDSLYVNLQDDQGRTPLYYAAAAEDGSVVQLLLGRSDVAIDLTSYFQGPPLHNAIDHGRTAVVRRLIEQGADVESEDAQGQRPIHKAVKMGASDILTLLLENRCSVTATTHSGHTPLELAMPMDSKMRQKTVSGVWRGQEVTAKADEYTPCLRILLGAYTLDDINKGGILFEAVKDGRPDIVQHFLQLGALPSVPSTTFNQRIPLHWASEKGFDRIVQLLLDHGSQISPQDKRGYTPLHYACSAGRESTAALLLTKSQHLDIAALNALTALHCARLQGHETISRLLLRAGATDTSLPESFRLQLGDIERRHKSNLAGQAKGGAAPPRTLSGKDITLEEYRRYAERLITAARFGDVEGVLLSLSKGVDVGERDHEHSKTALHWAAEIGHQAITQLLLSWNSDLSHQDQYGETPLHYAAENGSLEIVKEFLQHAADPAILDDRGRTAMRCARDNFHTEVVHFMLLQWDGDKEQAEEKDAQGRTLARWAAEAGYRPTLTKLDGMHLAGTAFLPDKRGRTPIQYAELHEDMALASLVAGMTI